MATDTATSNGSRLIGPLLGGAVYQWIGGVGIFAIAAGLYALALFLMMSVRRSKKRQQWPTLILWRPSPELGKRYGMPRETGKCFASLVSRWCSISGVFPCYPWCRSSERKSWALSPSLVGIISALEGGSALIGALTIARFVQPSFYRKIYFSGVCALLAIIFTMGQFPGLTTLVIGLIGAGFAGPASRPCSRR